MKLGAASIVVVSLVLSSPARAVAPSTSQIPVVAVFEIADSSGGPREHARTLTAYLRVKLSESGAVRVVDRGEQEQELKKLLAEQKKASYAPCVDDGCQIPLGKVLAADRILRSTLSRLGSTYILSAEMIDVATETTVAAASEKSNGGDAALLASVEHVARSLIDGPRAVTREDRAAASRGAAGGVLTVRTRPADLSVLIDGEPAGLSPIERRAVAAGEHEISIDDRCHQQTSARVALASGDERTVDLEVIPRRSSIDVRARDEKGAALEAEVSLDGEPLGPAPNLWQIPTCARVVDVRAPGYSRFRVDVIAQEGKTQRIEAVLKAEGTGWASSGSGDTGRRRRGAAVAGDTAAEETIGGQGANGPVDGAPPRLATVDHGWLRLGLGAAVSVYCGERRGTESDCSATYTGGGALGSIVVFADSVVQLEARAGVMYFAAPKEQPELSPIIEVPLSAGAAVDVMRVAGKGTPGWFFLALELAYSHRSAVNARTLSTFAEDELGIGGGMWVRVSSLELGFSLHAPVTTEAGLLTGRIWLGYSFAIL